MSSSAAVEQLQELGFTQYEAQAYVALLQNSPANGYELARASGIPRPNIYGVLQKLEERGAVLRVDGAEGTRFTPLDPQELLAKLKQQYQGALASASSALTALSCPAEPASIHNLRGYGVMLDHARAMLEAARERLLISVWPEEAQALAEPVQQAVERGVQTTTLCLRGCPQPCAACKGEVFRFPVAPPEKGRWFVLIPDDREILAGEVAPQGEALAVRTRQEMLVHLSACFIQNSIALASILNGLGGRLDELLDPQSLSALDALHPLQAQGRWLDMMRQRLHSQEDHL